MDARTGENRSRLQSREERLSRAMDRRMENDKKRLAEASGRLWGLSPLRKLSQGFGYIEESGGKTAGLCKAGAAGERDHRTGGRRNAFGPGNGKE